MLRYLLCLLFFTAALLGNAQYSLNGNVYDENGQPLPGATVRLENTDYGAATDADGFFRMTKIPANTYVLLIDFMGYESVSKKIEISKHTSLDFNLIPAVNLMQEVEVLSTWADAKTPVTYTNLTREDIEKTNLGQDVPYLLKTTPSAVVTSDAGTGIGYTGIRIRGTDPTRINVTINGIPLNDSESQGVFWVNMPDFLSSTEVIQVQRGVGTSTNGTGAFGATINLSTASVSQEPSFTLANSVGSFGTIKNNIQGTSGLINGKFVVDGRLSRIKSDGFIDRGSARLASFFGSAAYLGDRQSLRFNVFTGAEKTYQAWNGVPVTFADSSDVSLRTFNTAGTNKPGEPHDNEVDDYQQTHYQLHYDVELSDQMKLGVAGHYTRGKGFFELYEGNAPLGEFGFIRADSSDLIQRRWLDNHFYGMIYNLEIEQNEKMNIILGGGINRYEGRHFGEVIWTDTTGELPSQQLYYDNDATKVDWNTYLKINYALTPQLNAYVDLQHRMINYQFEGLNDDGNPVPADDQLHFFNPKAGLFYTIDENQHAYASFGVAHREPNRNDYTETSANSRPQAERLLNTEVGYRANWKRAMLGINFYHMLYKDQLVLTGQINDVGQYTRVNVDESYRLGIELEAGINLLEHLNWSASATLSSNKVINFTEFIDDWDTGEQLVVNYAKTDLAFSPGVIFTNNFSYDVIGEAKSDHFLQFALLTKVVGRQYLDNTSNDATALDRFSYSDFRATYIFKGNWLKQLALTAMVRNLFDAQYETNGWVYRFTTTDDATTYGNPYTRRESGDIFNQTGLYPQAGRNYLVGLTLTF